MASRNVVKTAILGGAVIQSDPAGEVGHGGGDRPVGVILVPGHNSTMVRGLAKELIVPEAHRSPQKLRGCHGYGGTPQHIVKTRFNSPSPQSVKQSGVQVLRLVGMVFVEKGIAGMCLPHQAVEFGVQPLDLLVAENLNSGNISLLLELGDLITA
jgi:hypothetical protein